MEWRVLFSSARMKSRCLNIWSGFITIMRNELTWEKPRPTSIGPFILVSIIVRDIKRRWRLSWSQYSVGERVAAVGRKDCWPFPGNGSRRWPGPSGMGGDGLLGGSCRGRRGLSEVGGPIVRSPGRIFNIQQNNIQSSRGEVRGRTNKLQPSTPGDRKQGTGDRGAEERRGPRPAEQPV